ncbi:hypothetical protein HFP15_12055 [Amycolatopsis sp. K13G38]|uniref:Uncharacterized protein n=1 Tax=Amycolatopsis acididurans TaxID=2724524 RepID=A0ABX1J5M0_9PSEU|nr:hypothetical protein [Amycolatopsis acididurans]NKQ53611.1 hypothetical protein [Amycolatopsis acididurans]
MPRPSSTVVVVAGAGAAEILPRLDGLANVRAAAVEKSASELVAQAHAAYVVHDADPLADLATAWTDYFDGAATPGTLEVAVESTLAALRSGAALLPDYYVVLDPESLPPTRKHWWLGVLAGVSPSRVVPCAATAGAVAGALSRLPSGRWWPDPPDEWLRGLPRAVPDRVGLP